MPLRPTTVAAALVLALTVSAGCESDASGGGVMTKELGKICNAVALSGAPQDGTTNDLGVTAIWLSQNIKSEEGLAFLRAFAKLGDDKAARYQMLADAARSHGIRDCPLLAYWK